MANKEIDQAVEGLANLTVTPPPFPSLPPPISSTIYRGLRIPSSWEEVADSIAYDSCTCPPPIVFICGPGNCGKSIFSRVLLDTLFKRQLLLLFLLHLYPMNFSYLCYTPQIFFILYTWQKVKTRILHV